MFNTKKFKELRKRKKISVDQLAVEISSTKATIYHYQAGTLQPSEETIEKIANYLQISKEVLIIDENLSQNPYKDALVAELKSEVNYLKQMIAFLTDGKVKDDLVKLKGVLCPTDTTNIIQMYVKGASEDTPTKQVA